MMAQQRLREYRHRYIMEHAAEIVQAIMNLEGGYWVEFHPDFSGAIHNVITGQEEEFNTRTTLDTLRKYAS